MRDKIQPWIPATYCALVAVIVTIANLLIYSSGGSDSGANFVFMLNMPMCFLLVGGFLRHLRNENRELRARLDAMARSGSQS